MVKSHVAAAAAILGSVICLQAQSAQEFPASGKGFQGHSRTNVIVLTADEYELVNPATHEVRLTGNVKLRPATRPVVRAITVKNAAGAPFPPARPVRLHFTGQFEIRVDGARIRADEADVDSGTGDAELRGNVTLTPGGAP
jgi:lipopolysaccharide export system protein LptA